MPKQRYPRVSIVGAGPVGAALGRALHDQGYPIVSVISRTGSSAIALARAVKCRRASTQIGDLSPDTECLLLTVRDGALTEVAAGVARLRTLKFKSLFAAHCSGVHSADILEPLRRRGALVASVHPVQTFSPARRPPARRVKLRGIYFGIEGEPAALKLAERLIADLGGRPVTIRKELMPLYHAVCVFASNYLMIFLNAIEELTKVLGAGSLWQEMFGPLMMTTIENAVTASPAASLTGPIVRGDLATIDAHLLTLASHAPQFLPFYISAGIEVARVGKERQRISQEDFDLIIGQFRRFLRSRSFTKQEKGQR